MSKLSCKSGQTTLNEFQNSIRLTFKCRFDHLDSTDCPIIELLINIYVLHKNNNQSDYQEILRNFYNYSYALFLLVNRLVEEIRSFQTESNFNKNKIK